MKYHYKNIKIALATGLASLVLSCDGENPIKDASSTAYFASIPANSQSGMAITPGDYNEDGHLDIVVGAIDSGLDNKGKLYLFLGDGKGNFRRPEQTAEKPAETK